MGGLFGGGRPNVERDDISGDGGDASQKAKKRTRRRAADSRGLRSALLAEDRGPSSDTKKTTLG